MVSFMLLNGLSVLFLATPSGASRREIYVDDSFSFPRDGTAEHPYHTISEAISLANEGDTIYVFGGRYNETLTLNKKISLIGGIDEGPSIISRGTAEKYTVDISADFVTLENFTITDPDRHITSMYGALVHVTSNDVVLQKNNLSYCDLWGIYLDSADDSTISGNIVNATKGVLVSSSNNNVFSYNSISNSTDAAIDLRSSIKNIIYHNSLTMNTFGIYARDCLNTNMTKNNITRNIYHGMYVTGDKNDIINENFFMNNSVSGITLSAVDCILRENICNHGQNGMIIQKTGCQISGNWFQNLSSIGLSMLSGTRNNVIAMNHFERNEVNAKDQGQNQWDDGKQGNYWDDYRYVDRDLDGIGDRPYTISRGVDDRYPLGVFLKPPRKPSNPDPTDDEENVGLKVTLNVTVVDDDSSIISEVTFYNAVDNSIMGSDLNVASGTQATCKFILPFDTVFAWYAIANDSLLQNQSDIWFFTTRQRPPENQKPVANPGGPYIGKLNQTISFNGSQSTDPDGSIIFYRWNFGDGSSQILDRAPQHTYSDPGVYMVTLTVVDNDGRSAYANTTATISGEIYINSPPVAVFNAPFTITVSRPVDLDASGSTDVDGSVVGYRWDFSSDGAFDTDWLASSVVNTTFSVVGNTTVTLEVKDNANGTSSFAATLDIHAAPKKSPGFELLLLLLGILICLVVVRRRNR
jgi:parallel beta-helix repeat protein